MPIAVSGSEHTAFDALTSADSAGHVPFFEKNPNLHRNSNFRGQNVHIPKTGIKDINRNMREIARFVRNETGVRGTFVNMRQNASRGVRQSFFSVQFQQTAQPSWSVSNHTDVRSYNFLTKNGHFCKFRPICHLTKIVILAVLELRNAKTTDRATLGG